MTDVTLTQMLDLAEKHAKKILIGTDNDLMPVFDLRNAQGESMVLGGPFIGDTPEELEACKDMVVALVRAAIAEHQIVKYSFLSEAWMLVVRHEPGERLPDPMPKPSQSPERVEVVIAIATDGQTNLCRRWLIERKGKKCVGLKCDSKDDDAVLPSGRFDSLLGTPTRH